MTPTALSNEELADRIAALDWSGTSLQHQLAMAAAVETLRGGRREESGPNPVGACQEPLTNPVGEMVSLLEDLLGRPVTKDSEIIC